MKSSFFRSALVFGTASYFLPLFLIVLVISIEITIKVNVNEYVISALSIIMAIIMLITLNYYIKTKNKTIMKIIGFEYKINKDDFHKNIESFFKPKIMNINAYILWLVLTMAIPFYATMLSVSVFELEKSWAKLGIMAVALNSLMGFHIWVQAAKEYSENTG